MKAGTTVELAAAEYKVPEKYKGYSVSPNLQGDAKANLEIIYNELKR